MTPEKFDAYAQNYDDALAQGLAISGESREFFARQRLIYLRDQLRARDYRVQRALDFGCGTGSATPYFFEILGLSELVGIDVSQASLERARHDWSDLPVRFLTPDQWQNQGQGETFDLAFCNGVFHHIPPVQRDQAISFVANALPAGGLFSLWENNPWNPGTRYVMGRCPFDDDAQTLSPPLARKLLRAGGFQVQSSDFLFYFPGALQALRPLEKLLHKLPLGAQYQILSKKHS